MTDEELLEKAKERYEICRDFWREIYIKCKDDWNFVHGYGQWDDEALTQRQQAGSPCLVLNQLDPFVNQVTNDIKQARLAIRVVPVDEEADIDTAEIRAGIIRNIEKQSNAKSVYGNAATHAVGAGIGWIIVDTDYCSPDTFDQEAYIERVVDFEAVMIDPDFETIDGSDAEDGFEKEVHSIESFERNYPDYSPNSFDSDSGTDEVVVVRYSYKDYEEKKLIRIKLIDGSVRDIFDDDLKIIDEHNQAIEDGEMEGEPLIYEEVMKRDTQVCKVMQCVLSGTDVLEEPQELATQYIPLVPVIGRETFINEQREFWSLIRQAKDAQKMYNYWKSYSTETIALQPKAPHIGAVGSFRTDAKNWANANRQNLAYLQYDIVYDENGSPMPPPMRQPNVQGSQALVQEATNARDDIRLALGLSAANMGERSNVISGVALRTNQIEGDNATFHFIDNLASSISQVGRILNELITALYSERKIARIIGDDDREELVPINSPYVREGGAVRAPRQGENPEGVYKFDTGKYDIDMNVGASYSSKRQEMADKLTEIIRAKPEILEVTGDLLFEALDLPYGREIADRIKTMLPPEMIEDDPQAARLQQAQAIVKQLEEQVMNLDAALQDKRKNEAIQNQIDIKKVEQDGQKLQIEAKKAEADIQKTMAEIEKMRAETTGFRMEAVDALGQAVQGMNVQMQDIQQAIGIMLDAKEAESIEAEEVPETSE